MRTPSGTQDARDRLGRPMDRADPSSAKGKWVLRGVWVGGLPPWPTPWFVLACFRR